MITYRIIYIFVIVCSPSVKSENRFFVVKKYGDNYYKCVTNSSAALSWITKEVEKTSNEASKYIPTRTSYFDCDIEEGHKTAKYYAKSPWVLGKAAFTTILDRRWEDMPIEMTDFATRKFERLTFKPISKITEENFRISLSIRTEKEAHIFLCDGDVPPEANCYWFLLQAWKGEATGIRKCRKGLIPFENDVYPEEPCYTPRIRFDHGGQYPKYLSNQYWSHFELVKQDNHLYLIQIIHKMKRTILELTDNDFTVTDIIIHSKMVNALWKIHEIVFIYTSEQTNDIALGPPIYPQSNVLCISMFVSMCQSCRLKLKLVAQDFFREQIYSQPTSEWSEIKFLVDGVLDLSYQLLVSTIDGNGNVNSFWSIDKARQCQKTEYRLISTYKKAKCQLMTSDNNVISPDSAFQAIENSCPEDTIGDICVPCKWIYSDCKRIKICSKNHGTDSTCTCSAGYRKFYSSDYCYENCNEGNYGHSCLRRCGKCYYNCNAVDGTCSYCTENYSGSKCDIPPVVIFANPPKVVTTNYDNATIQIDNFQLQTKMPDDRPSNYFFQITEDKNFDKNWTFAGETLNWLQYSLVTITNLKSDTTYFIRAVVGTTKTTYYNSNIPYAEFRTKCDDIAEYNVNVVALNTSATVYIHNPSEKTCKIGNYRVTTSPYSDVPKSTDKNIVLENLQPYQNYTVNFYKDQKSILSKAFHTTEGEPEIVRRFKISPISPTTVALEWQAPFKLNGLLLHYLVEYQHLNYLACNFLDNKNSPINRLKVNGTSTTVKNLIPFSNYSFSVYAVNIKFVGIPSLQQISTEPSTDIQAEEVPEILNVTTYTDSVKLELSSIHCTKLRGLLLVHVEVTCVDKWCENNTKNTDFNLQNANIIRVFGLQPFSNYNLDLLFCRAINMCDNNTIKTHKFQTKPTVPTQVQNVQVFSKNSSSISLRWQPPYPPTGILKDFRVFYKNFYATEWTNAIIVSKNSTCKLWPEYLCVKITDLHGMTYCDIKISAKNEDPEDFGMALNLGTQTLGIEKSQRPYDLEFIWSLENDLELQWKHPNESNGEIQYFKIKISVMTSRIIVERTLNVTEETYNLTYHYKIEAKDLKPTTLYVATVSAYNGVDGHEAIEKDTSPPPIPSLFSEPDFIITNETISITLPSQIINISQNHNISVILLIRTQKSQNNNDLLKKLNLENFECISECQNSLNQNCNKTIESLKPGTTYNISAILKNTLQNKTSYKIYFYSVTTSGESATEKMNKFSLFALFLLLLVIPIAIILFRKRHQLGELKNHLMDNYFTDNEIVEENSVPLTTVPTVTKVQDKSENEPLYTNENVFSKPIKINEFQDYVKESIENGELERQHALFSRGQTKPWTYGSIKENKSKNRYNNLIAYDHSRVILRKIKEIPHSDYINANYIDGYNVPKAYIATQGPKSSTLYDFWRMIWQENVAHIAMLANVYESGKKKVEKYWPKINETLNFGNISITHLSTKVYADFEHRTFNVTRNEETRKVEQLHFSSWPDHGVPLYSQSLVPFLQKILNIPISSKSPVVVHCSAGVGRTGTILLCDISMRMAAKEGYVDILDILKKMREQRANLVDNVEQYKLVHLVILECLHGQNTSIACNEIEESVQALIGNGGISLQMKFLEETQWQDQAVKSTIKSNKTLVVKEKNRFPDIVPESQGQVFINFYKDETSSYINAVSVDGFRVPNRFIVTQQPMPNTIEDFWRLIDEKNVTVIVSLNEIDTKDKTSCHFWPSKRRPEMTPAPHITLKHSNTLSLECYNLITVLLNSKAVEVFSFKKWPSGTNCPMSEEQFLTFWEDSDAVSRRSETVVVTCYDGAKASGLYVAMSFVIEKMKLEHSCDVCQAVRTVRHNRNQFVREEEQFEFLYKAAVKYIGGFQSYANFN